MWPLIFDGSLHLLQLTGQVFLYAWTISSLSSETPSRKWLRFTAICLVMNGLFAALTPENSPASILLGMSVMVGAGALLTWRSDFLPFDKAVMASLLCGAAAVALSFYLVRELEILTPQRPTLDRTLATLIDDRLRRETGNPALPPSSGVVAALLRSATTSPDDGGVAATLMAPVRAGMKAREQIRQIDKLAAEQAQLVNMLAGGGTQLTSRAGEMAALRSNLTAEAKGKFNPPGGTADGSLNPLLGGPEPTPSPATSGEPALAAEPPPVSPAGPATNSPGNAVSPFRSGMDDTAFPPGLSPDKRDQWKRARDSIRISATGRSARGAFVMIGQRMIHEGETHQFRLTGTNYTFRLTQVRGTWTCRWEPVLDEEPATDSDIVFF